MLNKAMLIGRLGRDPEIRYTPDGSAVANFSIATTLSWNDRNSGEKREITEWHRIVAFRRLGEVCGQYLQKGKLVYIEGRIQTREWQDRDGNRRFTTEIVASDMQMLSPKGESYGGGDGLPSGGAYPEMSGYANDPDNEDSYYDKKPSNRSQNASSPAGQDDDIPF